MKRISIALALIAFLAVLALPTFAAPAYPAKPLEIVAPSGAGGGWDAIARAINIGLEKEKLYAQPMSVTNKVGGGGAVGFSFMQMNKGNDYELIVYSPPLIIKTIDKTLQGNYKDLTPLAKLITDYQVILVKADSPYKTLAQLLEAIKKDPTAVKFAGGSAPGSMDHLAMCKIAKTAGLDPSKLIYVAFAGGGEAITTLLGGNVAFISTGTGEALPQIRAGTVRALAISSKARLPGDLKDVPTCIEQGVNATYEVWRGVFGAPGMSKAAKDWWAVALKKMVATPTWKDVLQRNSWGDAFTGAEDFAKFLDAEYESYQDLMVLLGFAK